MAARPKDAQADDPVESPDHPEARLEALAGIVRMQGAIIAELVESNAEVREKLGLDPPKPTISPATPWRSVTYDSSARAATDAWQGVLATRKTRAPIPPPKTTAYATPTPTITQFDMAHSARERGPFEG